MLNQTGLQSQSFAAYDLSDACGGERSDNAVRGVAPPLFDPRLFRRNAEVIFEKLESYIGEKSIRGMSLIDPLILMQAAKSLTQPGSSDHLDCNEHKLREIIDLYIATGIQVYSPGYMGRQFGGVFPLTGIVDLVSAIVSQPASFYEAGQLPNIAERIMAEELNRFIGFDPENYAMVTTSGGSLANVTALLAARNDKLPRSWSKGLCLAPGALRPAIALSEDAHYSLSRAAGIIGIGEEQIIRLPINHERQICIERVRSTLESAEQRGLKAFCLVASAGTTSVGAFDPIAQLAEIAAEKDIWLHVDGAHGASLLLCDALRHRLCGIERVDSLTWDAHKLMFVPAPCTMLFYKDRKRADGAFYQEASYVFETKPDIYSDYSSANRNFECTKKPMIMNLWILWALHGKVPFEEKITYVCHLTAEAYGVLVQDKDFEILHRPESNILCFRYAPMELSRANLGDFQVEIRNRIREQGSFFISKVDIDGAAALRVVFMNHEIKLENFHQLLLEIKRVGQDIIAEELSGQPSEGDNRILP